MLDFLDKLGVTSLREYKDTYNSNPERKWDYSFGPAMAIGSGEVRLLDQAGAFSAFANSGRFNPVNPILEVRDRDGNVLEKFEDRSVQAMMPETAYIINSILSDVYARPAGSWRNTLTIAGQNVAAKTGTSNKKIGRANYPNNLLTFSYTPTILVATWVGNSDGSQMYLSAWGLVASAPINKQFLETVLKDKPMVEFEKPAGIIQVGSEYYPPNWDKKKNYDSRFRPIVLKDCTDEERRLEPTACKSKEQMEKEAEQKKAEEEAKKAAEATVPERPLNTGEVLSSTPPPPEPAESKPATPGESGTNASPHVVPDVSAPTIVPPPQIESTSPSEPGLAGPTPESLEPEHPIDFARDD
jgi:membrane peptidoglycan carboxypeptidase